MRHILSPLLIVLIVGVTAMAQVNQPSCPKIVVFGPAGVVLPGEVFKFTAEVESGPKKVGYKWRLVNARIVRGQGTNEVEAIYDIENVKVMATVEIEGLQSSCANSATHTFSVVIDAGRTLLDEYSGTKWNKEVKHLPAIKVQMVKNPNAQIYVILYYRKNEIASAKAHGEKIKRYFKADRDRLAFIFSESRMSNTRIYLVPPGVDKPTP